MTGLFRSFFMGGFECSTHRLRNGRRLDLIRSTRHDEFAASDYRLLQAHGILTARDGLRWTLIEQRDGVYDFSSATGMLRAARDTGMEVIWDLWHYGWPDGLDLFSDDFVRRFAAYAKEAIKHISEYTDAPLVSPINEISFFSWAGGEGGIFNPFAKHRGDDVKRQLVRASIEGIRAMREVNPAVRVVQVDPMINVLPRNNTPGEIEGAERYRLSQYAAWEMILGRAAPEFGGSEDLIDVIGVNYYIHNQFVWYGDHSTMIVPSDPRYRHLSSMLQEVYERLRRPVFIAETGIEDDTRPAWLRYVSREVYAARAAGVPIEGLCLYPIVNHPGWEDDRHCYNGMFDYADEHGVRAVYEPLAEELARQHENVKALREGTTSIERLEGLDTSSLDWAAHVMDERTEESRTVRDRV
jgi:beta-glucosidase/6-phospho-beta-glucosidase/beta-galactosidase